MWKRLPESCEVSVVQLTHTVWTQVNENEWVYYTPGVDSMTVLCADQDPVDVTLKGAGKLTLDPTCKGYSKAALLQPVRVINANSSKSGNNQLVQVELQSECCEELGTRLNLSSLNLDLSFRETVSHADDLKYVGVKIKDLEKHIQEHDWRSKHSVTHHGYSILLYVVGSLFCLYAAYRVVRCMVVKGLCRGAAGLLRLTYPDQPNPGFTGSGNVVNINIKSSNESLTSSQEAIPLRAPAAASSSAGEPEVRTSRRLRQPRTRY
jgi:hypothetical protein